MLCDIIVADENAVIGDPHVKVGLVAGDGGAVIWAQRIGLARAKEYLMTGKPILAPDALIIQDPTLLHQVDVFSGLKRGGYILINTTRSFAQLGLGEFVDMPGRVSNEFLFTGLKTMDLGVACDPINAYNDHCTMNKTLEYMAFSKAQVMFGTREGRFSAGEAAHYVMENSAEKLGDAILDLLDDPARRETPRHRRGQPGPAGGRAPPRPQSCRHRAAAHHARAALRRRAAVAG